jgi:RimJ/RimL family protein N-acetyltransferase
MADATSPPAPVDPVPSIDMMELRLSTPRLTLRPPEDRDAEAMWPWVGDPAFPRHMSWAAHQDLTETRAVIRGILQSITDGKGAVWAVLRDDRLIGTIGLHDLQWSMRALRYDRAEIGYWITPPAWGQGFATEATHAVLGFGFGALRLHKLIIVCMADNAASRRVIEKVGFRSVGRRVEQCWRDGRWHDQLDYELTVGEWRAALAARRS